MKPNREKFISAALALQGVPYQWGGKTPRGLDCSGLVTWCLYAIGGPDLRETRNSDSLWLELDPVTEPQPGDLAFYGVPGDPSHVVICLGGPHDSIIGACGGNSKTLTLEDADRQRAMVKTRPTPIYRPDLLGFRSTRKWWLDASDYGLSVVPP